MEDLEDPRAKAHGICGHTIVGGLGIEWICIKQVHDREYWRKDGRSAFYDKAADRHYFVPRWPNRSRGDG